MSPLPGKVGRPRSIDTALREGEDREMLTRSIGDCEDDEPNSTVGRGGDDTGVVLEAVGESGRGTSLARGDTRSPLPSVVPIIAPPPPASLPDVDNPRLSGLVRTFTLPVNSSTTGLGGSGISTARFSPGLIGRGIASGLTRTFATIPPAPTPSPDALAWDLPNAEEDGADEMVDAERLVVPPAAAGVAAALAVGAPPDLGSAVRVGRKEGTAAFRLTLSFLTGGGRVLDAEEDALAAAAPLAAAAAAVVVLEAGGWVALAARCAEAAVGLVRLDATDREAGTGGCSGLWDGGGCCFGYRNSRPLGRCRARGRS